MKLKKLSDNFNEPLVLALGFFDCMHLGHRKILNTAKDLANGAKIGIFTFDDNQIGLLKNNSKLIYTFNERLSIFKELGVDYTIYSSFSKEFMMTSADEFIEQLNKFNLKQIVCGFDYTFGCDRKDAKYLKEKSNVPVCIVDKIEYNNEKVSSHLIKTLLSQSRIEQANSLLCSEFFITGKVVHGNQIGSKIGFPTANVEYSAEKMLPSGVFASKFIINGNEYNAITNIGEKPTLKDKKITIESHVLNFGDDIYNEEVKIVLTKYLRPTKKFNNLHNLKKQLELDKETFNND